ncbi:MULTISPECIES: DUF4312 family protein [Yersinia]|jgi:uncharacterized protein (TIGR03578 family)|uniref:DUF4312 family protein n=1 Tax=Yersinia intermedia TaxID=631 RepID=A0A0T9MEX6_YERIN|nr:MULTISPECIES: DUF4312 family protein [Yersinia]AJJ20233.1 hypothetical protein CH53_2221 [Yersinia intermedia]ARB82816.1 cytoplasmic protein [Yersinia sp. FDAARGOS_228]AVL36557.1 cytoplasmic protein [Yersinia intermedia]MCB5298385.1 DUF4312 family protein [Yersinia intermedia]MCW8112519.1 DUF4312 family protein [Yersinia intermedia]
MKEQYTTQVQVKGKGDSKEKAFANALGNVQNTVLKSTQNILLRIEPQDVKVLNAELSVKNEKFLFFFLPRERKTYSVELDITVNVTIINTDKVVFISK